MEEAGQDSGWQQMKFEDSKSEFGVRYYRWALRDFEREIENGFPHVSQFKSGPCWHVNDMMTRMTPEERRFLGRALVRRFHKEAVMALGEEISESETRWCDEFLARALYPSPEGEALERRVRAGEHPKYIKRGRLRSLVKKELSASGLQIFEPEYEAQVLRYRSVVEGWEIITHIHSGERQAQLAYEHIIWSFEKVRPVKVWNGDEELWPVQLHNWISFAGWLGICSRTEWTGLVDEDGPKAAKELSALCQHFLNVAPMLLKGLRVEC